MITRRSIMALLGIAPALAGDVYEAVPFEYVHPSLDPSPERNS